MSSSSFKNKKKNLNYIIAAPQCDNCATFKHKYAIMLMYKCLCKIQKYIIKKINIYMIIMTKKSIDNIFNINIIL